MPDLIQAPLEAVGIKLADWRTGATEGAVSVWEGNPDMLVVIQGGFYGTNLLDVGKEPLNLAQDCLKSRVVYATQEHHWSSPWFDFVSSFENMWNLPGAVNELKGLVAKMKEAKANASIGEAAYALGSQPQSFHDYQDARRKAAYYLDTTQQAPVWVSEFGTSTKKGNNWWSYTLRALSDSDASWFYSPLGARAQDDVQGLFEPTTDDSRPVVGWKVQDLVRLQNPGFFHAEKLTPPGKCAFDQASNRAKMGEHVPLIAFIQAIEWTPTRIAMAVSVAVLMICLPLYICRRCCCRSRRSSQPSWKNGENSLRDLESTDASTREKKNLWCCTCQRSLPVTVPPGIASMLPDGATVPRGYSQVPR